MELDQRRVQMKRLWLLPLALAALGAGAIASVVGAQEFPPAVRRRGFQFER